MGGGWRNGARDGEAPHLAAGRGGAEGGEERGLGVGREEATTGKG